MHTQFSNIVRSPVVALCAVVAALTIAVPASVHLAGVVIGTGAQKPRTIPWKIYTPPMVESGVTLPVETHVIFHLPRTMKDTNRTVLLGDNGKDVRYWGYCFARNYNPSLGPGPNGFPGPLFLSEKERAVREQQAQKRTSGFSVLRPPSRRQLTQPQSTVEIRHQKEVFQPGETCYIMIEASAKRISLGVDFDRDGLNSKGEADHRTDPRNTDTDADGVWDGPEVYKYRSNPLARDSDGDGLLDGLEVTPFGRGTDPTNADTDADGLCDGYCKFDKPRRQCKDFGHLHDCVDPVPGQWAGEDKTINAKLDKGETDPLLWDTDKDGISDLQEFYNCLMDRKKDC